MHIATKLQSLVRLQGNWNGTVTALAAALELDQIAPKGAPHLAMWLRRHEPTLWWTYGVSIRFSRTGRKRVVHLSRRQTTGTQADRSPLTESVPPEQCAALE
jgi:hypothetical protein